jgi:hypothetical protein
MTLTFTPKWCGNGYLDKSRLASSRQRPCLRASTNLGERGVSFVGDTICALSGIGKDTLDRLFALMCARAWRSGGCPWLGGGSRLPSVRACFPFVLFILALVGWHFVSIK